MPPPLNLHLMTTNLHYNLAKNLKDLIYVLEPKSLYYLYLIFFIINNNNASLLKGIINKKHI